MWRDRAACRDGDAEAFFPARRRARVRGAGRGGEGGVRRLPGEGRVPRVGAVGAAVRDRRRHDRGQRRRHRAAHRRGRRQRRRRAPPVRPQRRRRPRAGTRSGPGGRRGRSRARSGSANGPRTGGPPRPAPSRNSDSDRHTKGSEGDGCDEQRFRDRRPEPAGEIGGDDGDSRSVAVRRAGAAAEAWRAALDAQRSAVPDHTDFYGLTREWVFTFGPLGELMHVISGQVAGYADSLPPGEQVYDDERRDDPRQLLAEAARAAGRHRVPGDRDRRWRSTGSGH